MHSSTAFESSLFYSASSSSVDGRGASPFVAHANTRVVPCDCQGDPTCQGCEHISDVNLCIKSSHTTECTAGTIPRTISSTHHARCGVQQQGMRGTHSTDRPPMERPCRITCSSGTPSCWVTYCTAHASAHRKSNIDSTASEDSFHTGRPEILLCVRGTSLRDVKFVHRVPGVAVSHLEHCLAIQHCAWLRELSLTLRHACNDPHKTISSALLGKAPIYTSTS